MSFKKYTYREYKPEDKADIIDLFGLVWDENVQILTRKIWEWKYFETPVRCEDSPTIFVMECDQKIIGVMGTLATGLSIKGKTFPALFGSDFLVHPSYLSAGIGFLRYIFNDVDMVQLGTPNERAYKLEKRMGCEDLTQFNDFISITNLGQYMTTKQQFNPYLTGCIGLIYRILHHSVFSLVTFSPQSKQLECKEVADFDTSFDSFWQKVSVGYPSISLRDKRFLRWRFVQSPNAANYRILTVNKTDESKALLGYLVFSIQNQSNTKKGKIVDFLVANKDQATLSLLLKSALHKFKQADASVITVSITDGHDWCGHVFRKHLFLIKRKSLNVINGKGGEHREVVQTALPVFLTLSDSDMEISEWSYADLVKVSSVRQYSVKMGKKVGGARQSVKA